MKEEQTYGFTTWTSWNHGHVTDQPHAPAQGPQEEQPLVQETQTLSEFVTSDKRLDNYHLHFSSRL